MVYGENIVSLILMVFFIFTPTLLFTGIPYL